MKIAFPLRLNFVAGLALPLAISVAAAAPTPKAAPRPAPAPREPFRLWAGDAPGALGKEAKDVPMLDPYLANPAKATGAAFIICPGGGYAALAPHEGRDIGMWLAEHGIAGFVLKSRLAPAYHHPAPMQDLTRAVRFVRAHAAEWGLDPKRVGAFGISGGGHLASCVLTRFDAGDPGAADPVERASSRPDLGVLCYPAVSMGPNGHGGSRKNLLGDNPSDAVIKELSNELHVSKETPPCFLFHTGEDTAVKAENSLEFAAALRRNGVPFALHIYPKGRHGIGLGTAQWDPDARHPWTTECSLWLKEQGWAR